MAKPDFKRQSWQTTAWSLWGRLYTGAASDTQLRAPLGAVRAQAAIERELVEDQRRLDPAGEVSARLRGL